MHVNFLMGGIVKCRIFYGSLTWALSAVQVSSIWPDFDTASLKCVLLSSGSSGGFPLYLPLFSCLYR